MTKRPVDQPAAELPTPLAPPTELERRLSSELREVMTGLMALGERNVAHEWELAAATDYISAFLEASSLTVTRRGFMFQGQLAQTLEVSLPGREPAAPVFVVGARYDSALGSPGADDNGSGAAALLVLARQLGSGPRRRALRLVFFSDASNRTDRAASGAPAYLADLAREEVRIAGMLELSGLGFYSSAPQSQSYPEYVPLKKRGIGDFVALAQYAGLSPAPMSAFADDLGARISMPVVPMVLLPDEAAVKDSAHRAFAEKDIPSFMLFDTHRYRYPDFGGPADTLERIDFERMARVVAGLGAALDKMTRSPSPKAAVPGTASGAAAPGTAASGTPSPAAAEGSDPAPLQPASQSASE